MGIVKNQSIKNSLFFYIGITFGAFSTIILYPNAFNVHPEHLGLLQIIVAYSTMISAFSLLGTPKTLIRFFPIVKNKNQLIPKYIYIYLKKLDSVKLEEFIKVRKLMINWTINCKNDNQASEFKNSLYKSKKVLYKLTSLYTNKLFPEIMNKDMPKFE